MSDPRLLRGEDFDRICYVLSPGDEMSLRDDRQARVEREAADTELLRQMVAAWDRQDDAAGGRCTVESALSSLYAAIAALRARLDREAG